MYLPKITATFPSFFYPSAKTRTKASRPARKAGPARPICFSKPNDTSIRAFADSVNICKLSHSENQTKKPSSLQYALMMASCWSGRRGSNSLPPPWQGGALPDELRPHIGAFTLAPQGKTTRIGLEPTTPSVTGWCSNQLSYRATWWKLTGSNR